MKTHADVEAMLSLQQLGWGSKRIAQELGVSRNTVKRYLKQGGWSPYQGPNRVKRLSEVADWIKSKFDQHRGNAEVIRQDLVQEHGIDVSLRTVERAVNSLRKQAYAKAKATVRFETPPGQQLQIDFGSMRIEIAGQIKKVFLFVATLGFSRRIYVEAFTNEKQASWMRGIEGAFRHFHGITKELLIDNPRTLVTKHDPRTREIIFNERFLAFTQYWGITPRACAPYRARTKGKDERAVGYVKRNAIAGRTFSSWEALQSHLAYWMKEIADVRIHGTTGEQPLARFPKEQASLQALNGKPPFLQIRELCRCVHADACVEVDTNRYSVPWSLIGERVQVEVSDGVVKIYHAALEVCSHPEQKGKRLVSLRREHLQGIIAGNKKSLALASSADGQKPISLSPLLRPLSEYAAVVKEVC